MPELNRERCVSCGLCARVCPQAVITYEDGAPVLHPERFCLECWHCAAICPQKAIEQEGLDLYPPVPEDELERLVTMRRSARHFKREPPDRAVLDRAMELAAWAPVGRNLHTWGWTALYGAEQVERLRALVLAWGEAEPQYRGLIETARGHRDQMFCGASCILFVHNLTDTHNRETDSAIAATTAELLLNRQGVGTCWGGLLRRAVNACPEARELLGLPAERDVYAVLLAGIPEGEPYLRPAYRARPEIRWK